RGRVLVDLQALFGGGGDVGREGGERASQVRRAARDVEPGGAATSRGAVRQLPRARVLVGGALVQRVGVEERLPVRGDGACQYVPGDPLDHVTVGGLAGGQEQPPCRHHRRHAGAR